MPPADNRPAEYLRRVQGDPVFAQAAGARDPYPISPMPLAERIRRKIVPQRGFCSIAPGKLVSDSLISGNGTMNIELMGDPYAEQILFHHECLLMPGSGPWRLRTPRIFSRKCGKWSWTGKIAKLWRWPSQHMNKGAIKQDTEPHLTVPAFLMQLDFPKAAPAKDYLRTVNFENGEIKVALEVMSTATGSGRLSLPGRTMWWFSGSPRRRVSR